MWVEVRADNLILLLALPKEAHFVSLKDKLFTKRSGVTKQTHKIGVPCMLITKIFGCARTSTQPQLIKNLTKSNIMLISFFSFLSKLLE